MFDYRIEKTWTTEAGLRAVVLAILCPTTKTIRHRCGYVEVSKEHPYIDKSMFELTLEVHGGVTYSKEGKDYPIKSDGWWFGFDCAHYGDTESPEYHEAMNKLHQIHSINNGGFYRSTEYCIGECEHLAMQLTTTDKDNE